MSKDNALKLDFRSMKKSTKKISYLLAKILAAELFILFETINNSEKNLRL